MKLPKVYATEKLKRIRTGYGSQAEFVDVLKIYDPKLSLAAYSKYENGKRGVPIETAVIIAGMLNQNVYKMFQVIESEEPLDEEEKRMLKY